MIEKEEEMTMTMQMRPLQWALQAMHHPMQMRNDRPEREQHQEKVTMQLEAMSRPAEVQAAHCHRQRHLESTCEIEPQRDTLPRRQPEIKEMPIH